MGLAVCKMCGGKGHILRPEIKVQHTIWRRDEAGDFNPEYETIIIGGVDACPTCTLAAEVDWNTGPALPGETCNKLK